MHARRGGAEGTVRGLGGHHVERGHRFREVHRVVEPEALVVRGGELHVVGIGGLCPLGPRNHRQRARGREGCGMGVRANGGSPAPLPVPAAAGSAETEAHVLTSLRRDRSLGEGSSRNGLTIDACSPVKSCGPRGRSGSAVPTCRNSPTGSRTSAAWLLPITPRCGAGPSRTRKASGRLCGTTSESTPRHRTRGYSGGAACRVPNGFRARASTTHSMCCDARLGAAMCFST